MTAPSHNTWDVPPTPVDSPSTGPTPEPPPQPAPPTEATPAAVVPANDPPRKGISIGVKATLLAAIFGVLPIMVVGNVAYQSADRSITERIAQEEIAEANQLADQLRRFMQERVANVNTVASIASYQGLFDPGLEPTDRARLITALTQELTDFVQDYRTYSSIIILDRQGNVIVQSTGSAQELNQANAAYFQQVLQSRSTVVSEPVEIDAESAEAATLGRFVVYVATPITSATGQIQGVVSATIPVDFIGNAILRAASQGEGSVYRLVDSQGNIFQSLPTDVDNPQVGLPLPDLLPQFADISAQKQRQAWIESANRQEFLNAYAPLQGFETLNWSVVTSTETRVAFLAQRQLLQTILLGTGITGVVAVVLAIVIARRATRPVEEVAQAVERLGQGELDVRVPVRGNDELAILGANVNRMGSEIQALLNTLRQNAEQLGLQNDVLAQLARHEALIQGDAKAAAKAFSVAIANTLQTQRVSIWLYQPGQQEWVCLAQHDPGPAPVEKQRLPIADAPDYLAKITDNQTLTIADVYSDTAVQELVMGGYLAPQTRSLLEVPIQIAGTVVGTVRCEQSDLVRTWPADEQTFVNSVANLISLALESEFLQEEVSHLLDVVSEVEEGNLLTQARVSDRTTGLVADTFNRLIERLATVLQQVIDTAQDVSAGANQQKAQAALVATNAEQQAQGVNQVLQLTEQVGTIAAGSAQQVQATNQSLQTVQESVLQGQTAITSLLQGISILQEGSDRIVQQMKTLGEFVGLADQFVQDQTQIASLTQTLALNASLVAARAAEQRDPRQFVVAAREFNSIANQVSQLAQQTNDSLLTLEQRSVQIHSVVSSIDGEVQNLGSLVQAFTQGVEQSNQVFSNVQLETAEAVRSGETIAQSSDDIVKAAQAAATVVRDIASLAVRSADLTQQSSQQADTIDRLAAQLLQTIQFFQLPQQTAEPLPPSPSSKALDN